MTAKTITIPLKEPIMGHAGAITNIIMREPTYDDYLRLGDPVQLIYLGEGQHTYAENEATIRGYIAACMVEPKDPLVLEQGGFRIARALKAAVLNFFRDDDIEIEPSPT